MRVLDAGCGSGRNLVYLLRSGYDVFGADADADAIESVRALAATLAPQLPGANFRAEAVEEMSFPDAFADVVLSSAVLHFARDDRHFEAMVTEMWRVLRPGGLLFCRLASAIGMETRVRQTRRTPVPAAGRLRALPRGRGPARRADAEAGRHVPRSAEDDDRAESKVHDHLGRPQGRLIEKELARGAMDGGDGSDDLGRGLQALGPVALGDPYMDDIAKFRDAREAVLKTDTGWLTIAGLFFLTKPDTTFGSDTTNDIVLPAGAPARAGTFSLRDGKVAVKAASGVSFVLNGNTITSADLKSDGAGTPDRIVLQDLTLWVHQSGDRLAIRLRDKNNHLRREFTRAEVVSGEAGLPGVRRVRAVRDAEDDADPEHPR